jgi:hypothetical protein
MAKDTAACWTAGDEVLLLNFLVDHASAAGDGGNFKMTTFTAAAAVVDSKRTKGGPKTAKACQNKWNMVQWLYSLNLLQSNYFSAAPSSFSRYPGHQSPVRLDLE